MAPESPVIDPSHAPGWIPPRCRQLLLGLVFPLLHVLAHAAEVTLAGGEMERTVDGPLSHVCKGACSRSGTVGAGVEQVSANVQRLTFFDSGLLKPASVELSKVGDRSDECQEKAIPFTGPGHARTISFIEYRLVADSGSGWLFYCIYPPSCLFFMAGMHIPASQPCQPCT